MRDFSRLTFSFVSLLLLGGMVSLLTLPGCTTNAIRPSEQIIEKDPWDIPLSGNEQLDTLNRKLVAIMTGGSPSSDALELADNAVEFAERAFGQRSLVVSRNISAAASMHSVAGNYELARKLYERAVDINRELIGRTAETARSIGNLAFATHQVGDYRKALDLYKEALNLNEQILGRWHPATGAVLNNLADLFRLLGSYQRARPYAKRVLVIMESAYGLADRRTALAANNLAATEHLLRNQFEAGRLYKRALSIAERIPGTDRSVEALTLTNLCLWHAANHQTMLGLERCNKALETLYKFQRGDHPDIAIALNNIARLQAMVGHEEPARDAASKALAIAIGSATPRLVTTVASTLGDSYARASENGVAILYYKIAVNNSQRIRARASGLNSALFGSLTRSISSNYKNLARLLIYEGRIAEAEQVLGMLKEHEFFEYVRRNEGRDVRNSLSDFTPEEKSLADALNSSAKEISGINSEIESLGASQQLSAEQKLQLEHLAQRRRIENKRMVGLFDEIKQQLGAQGRDKQIKHVDDLVKGKGAIEGSLKVLQQLGKNKPALIYFLPDDKTTLFMIHTKDGLRQFQGGLGAKALNERIVQFRQAIEKRDIGYKHIANELYGALIEPMQPYLDNSGIDMLMLYLTDSLRFLPFAALYDKKTKQHLIEEFPLAVFTHVGRDKMEKMPQEQWSAVALGTSQKTPNHPALPWVDAELKRIVRELQHNESGGILPGTRYLDDNFTYKVFMEFLHPETAQPVMHVATHFVLAPGNDSNSLLVLGNGDGLKLSEIAANAQLTGYDLITLSACETALGASGTSKIEDIAAGAEVEGLGSLLQYQGAPAVLATLWKVEDTGTAYLMQEFYKLRGEKRRTNKAQALREAQQALLTGKIKTDNPAKQDLRHPYYWAPFILMGNWL